jgi:hypothetical protein
MASNVQGVIYLLYFDRPYRHAGHYTGKPASSGLLQPGLSAVSRELVGTGRRPGLNAPPGPRGTTQTGAAAPTVSW